MNWKPELDDLSRREAFAREMGGADKVKRQHDQGRLTVRERIEGLIDKGSFVVAVLLAWLLLGERITPRIAVGTLLILTGLLVVARR